MLVVALAVAVATRWPLVGSLQTTVQDPFDPAFQTWQLDWVQHAIGSKASLWDANIFAGHERTLAYSDSMVGAGIALLPARWAGLSPIGVLNVGILLAYAASAAGGYVLGRVVTGRRVVAACTAVVFAFGPYNTFLGQHLTILFHPGPALAAAAAWALADRQAAGRPTAPVAVGLAAVVALQGTVSFYTFTFSVLTAVVVLAVRARSLGWRGLATGGLALVAAAVALTPLAWPYVQNARAAPGEYVWELDELRGTGADFLAVDPSLTVWGDGLGDIMGAFGQPVFPGLVALALGVYGALGWRRAADRRPYALAAALVVVGAALALGTSDQGWRRYAPYRLVYELLPAHGVLRGIGRYWVVGLLGLALLAGLGLDRLVRRFLAADGRRRSVAAFVAAAACCSLVVVEGQRRWGDVTQLPRYRPAVQPVDRELARLPGDEGVVYLPLPTGEGVGLELLNQAPIVFRTTAHHRPTLNGYGGFVPESFRSLGERLQGLPDEASLAMLRRSDVRWVVVGATAGPWQRLQDPRAAAPLRLVGRYGGELLYEVPPTD